MTEHEVYVKKETADLLKKAGFDWTVSTGYLSSSGLLTSGHFSNNSDYGVAAPTLDIAKRWLRVVKNYHIALEYDMNIGFAGQELYDFEKIRAYILTNRNYSNVCVFETDDYATQEEAEENAIIKAAKLIIENGESS